MWHRSEDEPREIEVAVKLLKNAADEKEKVQFLQEAAIVGQFDHPYIVKMFGVLTTKAQV